jgi:hypothetical protein
MCTELESEVFELSVIQKQALRDSAPLLNTQVQPARLGAGGTPRASTIQEAEEEWKRRSFLSNNNKSLEGMLVISPDEYIHANICRHR